MWIRDPNHPHQLGFVIVNFSTIKKISKTKIENKLHFQLPKVGKE
jgi:hypothetical protein